MISASRYHDFSCGHRVVGHESKCANLHGHNYRAHFHVAPLDVLDSVGRVLDFSVLKDRLCMWLEESWDHRFLAWECDPLIRSLTARAYRTDESGEIDSACQMLKDSLVLVPFNPTAENMAAHLLHVIGPAQLQGTGTRLVRVVIEETRKCSAEAY